MLLVGLSICVTVIVLNIHFRSSSTQKMSNWMRIVFLKFLPKILFMKRPDYQYANCEYFNQTNHSFNDYYGFSSVNQPNSDKSNKKKSSSFKNESKDKKTKEESFKNLKKSKQNSKQRQSTQLNSNKLNKENSIKDNKSISNQKSPFRNLSKNNQVVPLNSSINSINVAKLNNSIYSLDNNLDYQSNLIQNLTNKLNQEQDIKISSQSIQSLEGKEDEDDFLNDCNNNCCSNDEQMEYQLNRSDLESDNLDNLDLRPMYESNKSISTNYYSRSADNCSLCYKNQQVQRQHSDNFIACKHRRILSKFRNQFTNSIDQTLLNQTIMNQHQNLDQTSANKSPIFNNLSDYKRRNYRERKLQNESPINKDEKIFLDALHRIEVNPQIMRAMKNVYFLAEHTRKLQQEEEVSFFVSKNYY